MSPRTASHLNCKSAPKKKPKTLGSSSSLGVLPPHFDGTGHHHIDRISAESSSLQATAPPPPPPDDTAASPLGALLHQAHTKHQAGQLGGMFEVAQLRRRAETNQSAGEPAHLFAVEPDEAARLGERLWLDAPDPAQTRTIALSRGNRLRAVAFEDRDGCVIVLAVCAESALRRELKAGDVGVSLEGATITSLAQVGIADRWRRS